MSRVFLQGRCCFQKVFLELVSYCPAPGMLISCSKSTSTSPCKHSQCPLLWGQQPAVTASFGGQSISWSVFSCGHLPLHIPQGQRFGQAELVFLQSLVSGALLQRDSSEGVHSCGMGTICPQGSQLPSFASTNKPNRW